NAPHNPLQATEKYLSRFPDITDTKRKTYAAMVSAVDDGVGLLLDKLDQLKLAENTIIIFLSDNGGPETKNASNNGVLRGGKGSAWEGGYRVPFAMQWKGTLPEGKTYGHPVSSLDIMATIAELSGAPIDPKRLLDGVNLIPYLKGKNSGAPHDAIYLRKFDGGQYTVRSGDYKMIIPFAGGAAQLYNVAEDIGEENDIAQQHPEKLQRLEELRVQWDSQLVEPRFLGLIHTPEWQEKLRKKKKASKGKSTWDWFGAMDRNKDGTVTEDEWIKWSKTEAGRRGRSYNEALQKEKYAGRDGNGDGVMTRAELDASMGK
ncbi:MAG: sulfatase-like hydrolase/transferase, partial [Verrucomicrobiota bacterium]|nr:sulfatase-like hydrolase/transferase [Verrucomicrobiota bacterium]